MTIQLQTPRPVTPMSILADKLRSLVGQLDAAGSTDALGGTDLSWQSELRQACELASGLDPYLSQWSSPESVALSMLAQSTHAHDWSEPSRGTSLNLEQEMLSGHVEGQTLQMLVHATGAKRVLDIGMFTGYSALAMAEALPVDGEVLACELSSEVAEFAQRCFANSDSGDKITVRVGPALATLTDLAAAGAVFDLVFIDADKAGYLDYFSSVLDGGLLAANGLICADNTLLQGQPWLSGARSANAVAIARFNEAVAADPRVHQVIIPLRDGLTLIRRVDGL